MAPPPEYDKEPKAPDKTATSISTEDSKLLHSLISDQHTNSDHKPSNITSTTDVENKDVETLDDGQLRALLDEAITYKCPKDREGKSSLFKELLEEVEQDEQACEEAARTLSGCRGARRGGRGRRALPHSNSLQDLVAALAAEPTPRRHHVRHHPPTTPTANVSARAIHGGSLPSGVDTSSLSEEPARAGYLATVRCVNPPPLAERRVSASDANAPAEMELLNRRSKPMFPMTYTARATLEIGSGSVCSGRAVTTTTASNQVRTRPTLTRANNSKHQNRNNAHNLVPPFAPLQTEPPSIVWPTTCGPPERLYSRPLLYIPQNNVDDNQMRLMNALCLNTSTCAKEIDEGGGNVDQNRDRNQRVDSVKGKVKVPRGPTEAMQQHYENEEKHQLSKRKMKTNIKDECAQVWVNNVDNWYKGLSTYCEPSNWHSLSLNQKTSDQEKKANINYNHNDTIHASKHSKHDFNSKIKKIECSNSSSANISSPLCQNSHNLDVEQINSLESPHSNYEDISSMEEPVCSKNESYNLKKKYKGQLGRDLMVPTLSFNPKNIRSMTIGPSQTSYLNNKPLETKVFSKSKCLTNIQIQKKNIAEINSIHVESAQTEKMKVKNTDKINKPRTKSSKHIHSYSNLHTANALEIIPISKDIELSDLSCDQSTNYTKYSIASIHVHSAQSKNVEVENTDQIKEPRTNYSSHIHSEYNDLNKANTLELIRIGKELELSEVSCDHSTNDTKDSIAEIDSIHVESAQTKNMEVENTGKINEPRTKNSNHINSENSDLNTANVFEMIPISEEIELSDVSSDHSTNDTKDSIAEIDSVLVESARTENVEVENTVKTIEPRTKTSNHFHSGYSDLNTANALEMILISREIELSDVSCEHSPNDTKDSFSQYVTEQQKLFEAIAATNCINDNVTNTADNQQKHNACSPSRADNLVDKIDELDMCCDGNNNSQTQQNDEHFSKIKCITSNSVTAGNNEDTVQIENVGDNASDDRFLVAQLPNNAYVFLTLPKRLIAPLDSNDRDSVQLREIDNDNIDKAYIPESKNESKSVKKKKGKVALGSSSNKKRDELNKNTLQVVLFENLSKGDVQKSLLTKPRVSSVTADEVDSAISFSCITTPEVVASCNTTSSTTQSAVAVDPKPRSVISSTFNGLPLSRPNYGATGAPAADDYKKSLDENGNSVQGFSSPLSGSSQHKKPRRKKSSKNETVIDCQQIDGYRGDKDVNELLRFIESNAERGRGAKLARAKHKDEADDKPAAGKKRSAERRKDKLAPPKRASSLDELAPGRRAARSPAKPERRSWADDADAAELTDFQTVTKKRRPRRRAEPAARAARPPSPRSPRASAPPSDRSADSADDLDSVHSLPAPRAPPAAASYADIARTRHNIPDLIESCNFYAEGAPADQYPALEPAKPAAARAAAGGTRAARARPAPDVVADRRPPVVLRDRAARPLDMDGVTFGFDVNEQLLAAPRLDLVQDAEPPPAAAAAATITTLALAPAAAAHLRQIVDYIGNAWEDVLRCGGKVRYYSE